MKVKGISKRIMFAAATAVAALGLSATAASASAVGTSTWGAFTFQGYGIPSGALTHTVLGKGTYVSKDYATFTAAAQVCQWWMDFDYWDGAGRHYGHLQGAQHNSCSRTGTVGWILNQNLRTGHACATLYKRTPAGIATVTRQCHNIHA